MQRLLMKYLTIYMICKPKETEMWVKIGLISAVNDYRSI